jgi:hypothetical protein
MKSLIACLVFFISTSFAGAAVDNPGFGKKVPPDNGGQVGCVRTQGFWGNSPQGQQLLRTLVPGTLTLGETAYTADQLLAILGTPVATPGPGANALLILAKQLIAARLNQLAGANVSNIAAALAEADDLIDDRVIPPVGDDQVSPSSSRGQSMIAVASLLDDFNNGLLGVPSCR